MNTKHFKESELACKCCGDTQPNVALMIVLEDVRVNLGVTVITSGYRCSEHNKNVEGAKRSRHLRGDAADFYVVGKTVDEVYNFLESRGYSDIIGLAKGESFVHVDVRGTKARWTY